MLGREGAAGSIRWCFASCKWFQHCLLVPNELGLRKFFWPRAPEIDESSAALSEPPAAEAELDAVSSAGC